MWNILTCVNEKVEEARSQPKCHIACEVHASSETESFCPMCYIIHSSNCARLIFRQWVSTRC